MENGVSMHAPDKVGPRQLINRIEYVRLIQQALHKLGYVEVAQHLERESRIQMQPPHATNFQRMIMEGDWDGAVAILPLLSDNDEVLKSARFLVLQQKYLEALEAQDFSKALVCLRAEMAPLKVNESQLHHLAGLLLCPASVDAQARATWLGGGKASRAQLMQQLQAKLPPSLMIPDGRLEQLVEQALVAQVSKCQYHNALDMDLSLFSDYQAGIECLPTHLSQVLDVHTDEVWHIAFSYNGQMLASASKDCTTVIWAVQPHGSVVPVHTLAGHGQAVDCLAWSPDDRMLLTCSDKEVRLWDTASGQLLHTYRGHRDIVTSVAWMPDSSCFFSGSVDRSILVNDVSGAERQRIKRPTQVQDLAVAANGSILVIVSNDHPQPKWHGQINLLRLSDYREAVLVEGELIMSITLSPDSRWLLANLNSHTAHLWALGDVAQPWRSSMDPDAPDPFDCLPETYELEFKVNESEGKIGRVVLKSGFGGGQSNFVVSGSEDCSVYVFHRSSGDLLSRLEGHSQTVNSVSWNPRYPHMLASASDDRTIRVWMAQAALPSGSSSSMMH